MRSLFNVGIVRQEFHFTDLTVVVFGGGGDHGHWTCVFVVQLMSAGLGLVKLFLKVDLFELTVL